MPYESISVLIRTVNSVVVYIQLNRMLCRAQGQHENIQHYSIRMITGETVRTCQELCVTVMKFYVA